MAAVPAFYLTLIDQARIDLDHEGIRVSAGEQSVAVRNPTAFLAGAVQRLSSDGASEDSLYDEAIAKGETLALFSLLGLLQALDQKGFLKRHLVANGAIIAT